MMVCDDLSCSLSGAVVASQGCERPGFVESLSNFISS